MRLISSYVLKEFISFLVYCILAFAVIFILVDSVENLDNFIDSHLSISLISLYYVFYLPYILILTLPVSMLLSTMFSLGRLIGDNEITAMKASGVSFYRILLPLYIFSFFIGIFALLFTEFVVPRANLVRQDIKQFSRLRKVDENAEFTLSFSQTREMDRHDVYLANSDGRIVYAQRYRSKFYRAENVFILKPGEYISKESGICNDILVNSGFGTEGFKSRLNADSLVYKDGIWYLYNVSERTFQSEGEESNVYDVLPAPWLQFEPSDFARIDMEPEEMDYFQLSEYIRQVKMKGGDASEWLVDLYMKIAFPFVSLVIVFFGAPLAAGSTLRGKTASFGIALVICFIYYTLINAFQILGRNGALESKMAAWLPNGVFLFIGMLLHLKARK